MPPNGEVYGITGPLRMRVGRSYATERGSVWDNGRPMVAPTKREGKEKSV